MIEVVYWLSVALGCVGALTGSRAALPLLASVALSYALDATGAYFETGLWIAIDICVIVTILSFRERVSDWLIVGLFPVMWVMYFLPPWAAYNGVSLLMALQFVFTLPWIRIWDRIKRTAPCRMEIDDFFNLMIGVAPWGRKI